LYNPKYRPVAVYEKGKYIDTPPIPVSGATGFYTKEKSWSNTVTSYQCDYYISSSTINDATVTSMVVPNDDDRLYWHRNVFEAPETLNFWIEFLDSGELSQF